jgi:serine/threonine protein kinase
LEIPHEFLVVEEKLGEGTFGTVFKAQWKAVEAAVKLLKAETLKDTSHQQEILNNLRHEVLHLSRLRHPNIVSIYLRYHNDSSYVLLPSLTFILFYSVGVTSWYHNTKTILPCI